MDWGHEKTKGTAREEKESCKELKATFLDEIEKQRSKLKEIYIDVSRATKCALEAP